MKRLRLFPAFFVLFALLACGGEEPSSEQPAPAAINTAVALTDTPVPPTDTPVALTNTPMPPTNTPVALTNTAVPLTDTPMPPTNTPVPPTNTAVPPTNTAVPPTNTPVPPTNTPVPPTNTPVSVPHFTVNSDQVNVRTGPGTAFSIIGTVEQGGRFDIGGRNGAGDWLEFCCVNEQRGWIYAPLLVLSHDISTISISANIPAVPTATNTPVPPTPAPPTAQPAQPTQPPSSNDGLGIRIEPENRCSPTTPTTIRIRRVSSPGLSPNRATASTARTPAPISPAPARRTSNTSSPAAKRMTAACAPWTAPPGRLSAATCSISPWPAPA